MKHFFDKLLAFKPSRIVVKAPVVLLAVVFLSGCSSVGYYSQIVSGHMGIVMGKRPVDEVLSDKDINESLKRRLHVAQRAREFAVTQLNLPDNESYTSFYDTGKRYVTWNVVAAAEFSFIPRKWCFPIAGCVSYRGYYAEEDAQSYAEKMKQEGLDVTVNGATAYSTLGYFKDPLLNTMLARSDPAIASLLFHELAHQQLYVGDDSKYNESFASFVEREGLKEWEQFEALSSPQPEDGEMSAELAIRKQRQEDFIALLRTTRDDLEALYSSDLDEDNMREKKIQRFQEMRSEYEELKKQRWDGYEGYDGWFERELNNARLVSVATYNDYVPAFKVMFEQSGGSFTRFYQEAQRVADLPAEKRTAVMQELLGKSSALSQ